MGTNECKEFITSIAESNGLNQNEMEKNQEI